VTTQDRDAPLVVSGPRIRHDTQRGPVETTQIAPTILALLGLDPCAAGRRRRAHRDVARHRRTPEPVARAAGPGYLAEYTSRPNRGSPVCAAKPRWGSRKASSMLASSE